jgi:serine/threonine protein kinase
MSQERRSQVCIFILESVLGVGGFASVWRGHHLLTGLPVAIKVISKDSLGSSEDKFRLEREISFLKSFDYPFIAKFFELLEDSQKYYLILEFVSSNDLSNFMISHGRLTEEHAHRYFAQLVFVLEYLQGEKRIAHRDL